VVAILTPIYEAKFLGFSYGFRPRRNQHQALDALAFGIGKRRINWILDADIQSFFDTVSQEWLIRFIEHRVGDRRVVRLIRKWLAAGVLEDGQVIVTEEGTPQGAVISPLLANIYLHYVYDLGVQHWRQRSAKGDVIVVRYADDTIVGFEHWHEAEQFLADLKMRLARFAAEVLSPRMVGLIEGLAEDWRRLDERIDRLSGEITALARQDAGCERLVSVPGNGPIISSTMVAAIGTGEAFSKGRDFAAWLGLVPKQISTGDRTILGKISKRGNRYLRVLFVQAAWVVLIKGLLKLKNAACF
jgi:hypothetical protein